MEPIVLERTVRPGLWRGRQGEQPILVREIPAARQRTYERAAAIALPVPSIDYVGPTADPARAVVVERVLATGRPDAEWRTLLELTPVLRDDVERLTTGLTRMLEALCWMHAAGFVHGAVSPEGVIFHRRGGVALAGLDCLQVMQRAAVPCVGYSPRYVCREQLEGVVVPVTDVRLAALALATTVLDRSTAGAASAPAEEIARETLRLRGDHPVYRLMERMAAVDPRDRPEAASALEQARLC